MEASWIALVIASAGIHPVRDLLLKGGSSPNGRYFLYALCWIPMTLVHGLVFEQNLSLPPALWLSVCLSALGLVLYYFGTFEALRVSDLSIYYPIIRCSPVAILLFSFIVLGVQYSLLVVVSILMIFVGTIMLQKPKGGIFGNRLALLAAVLAMVGSAIYTIVDARAMQAVQPGAYLFYIYLLVSAGLLALLAIDTRFAGRAGTPNNGAAPRRVVGEIRASLSWRVPVAAATSYAAYLLVLQAFAMGGEAAAVSAVRQASIPVSVLMGVFILRESGLSRRFLWSIVIAAGIAAIGLFGRV